MDIIVFTTLIVNAAGMFQFALSEVYMAFSFLVLVSLFIWRKRRIKKQLVQAIIFWLVINTISLIVNDKAGNQLNTLIGFTSRIFIAYFMIEVVGKDFFLKLVTYLWCLCLLSTPFYIIHIIFPSILEALAPFARNFTIVEQANSGGAYFFFYNINPWSLMSLEGLSIIRNSGFMWEPGGYAMILIFVLTIRLYVNNSLDKKDWFLFVLLLSTFSTSGYLAIIFLLGYNYSKSKYFLFLVVPILLLLSINVWRLEFMSGKLEHYNETIDYVAISPDGSGNARVNRIAHLFYSTEAALNLPTGNGALINRGIVEKYGYNIHASNTLAEIMYRFGFQGLLFFIFLLYSFYGRRKRSWFLVVAFSIMLFSNPMISKHIFYCVIFYALLYKKNNYHLQPIFVDNNTNFKIDRIDD